jgi:hypothetical protein
VAHDSAVSTEDEIEETEATSRTACEAECHRRHADHATVTFEGGEPVRYEFNDYDGVWTVMPTN